ncbi:MAG: DUF1501 domain-containing protein [Pseudomonadota bacterium]
MQNRRDFLKTMTAAASMVGMAGAPKFSFAQQAGQKTFIKVFMRGGADGLHLFPLIGDPFYYQYRPDIAIEPPSNDINSAVDLGSTMRGMNPNLEMLMEIWDGGNMMIAPATSFDPSNRSHFDCQRWIGTGQTRNNLIDGYLNRYMQNVAGPDHPLRGLVAGKTSISTEARGAIQVPAINDANGFNLRNNDFCEGNGCADNQLTELMREIHSHDIDLSAVEGQLRDNQLVMLDSIAEVQAAGMDYTPSAGGLDYTNSGLGRGLRLCAQLLKAGVPLEVAALDWNIGWDTHSNQISDDTNRFTDQDKSYHRRMVEGANDFLCFYRDMGAMMNDVVVLVGSEFGRTKKQNGSVGTDHGEGGAWFAFGGPTTRAIADDVTTIDDTVFNRNWLPTVTNYRNIIGEIMVRHMAMPENLVSTIFPTHSFTNYQLFNASA